MTKRWSPNRIATVGAGDSRFPAPETLHWKALRTVPQAVREILSVTDEVLNQIENDINLSPEGKKNQSAIVAREAIAKLEQLAAEPSPAVERHITKLQEKINAQLAQGAPKDAAEVAQMAEIRAYLSKQKSPAIAAMKLKGDPKVVAAVLNGPGFLSGLSDEEKGALQAEAVKEFEQQKEINNINGAVAVGRQAIKSARAMITERTGAVLDSPAPAAAKK